MLVVVTGITITVLIGTEISRFTFGSETVSGNPVGAAPANDGSDSSPSRIPSDIQLLTFFILGSSIVYDDSSARR